MVIVDGACVKTAFALTIFLSAFLLFQVELIVGRELLPWFGGAPAVWTTCLVFFQVVLLAAYAYAHIVTKRLPLKRQLSSHMGILTVSCLILAFLASRWPTPITPGASWKPAGDSDPVSQIALLLAVSLGVPFFVLSTTGPLLQKWSLVCFPESSPYRLYALSNAGSLIGLLGYPFFVEPILGIRAQAFCWTGLYVLFGIGVVVCALGLRRSRVRAAGGAEEPGSVERGAPPSPHDRLLWTGLAAVASALLLSTTNHMCQDMAVVPLLWVLPLSLYLLSFILCFGDDRLYRRWMFPPLFAASCVFCIIDLFKGLGASLPSQIGADCALLFSGCMVCHGELVRAKPGAAHLTGFYLAVAAGGALGGLALAIAAPRLFNGYWEFHLSILGTGVVFIGALMRDRSSILRRKPVSIGSGLALIVIGLGGSLLKQAVESGGSARFASRNFYGILRVVEDPAGRYLKLLHGRITHGFQFTDSARAFIPTSYYSRESGVGLAILNHPERPGGLRIGVVGMGTGTLAAYAGNGDTIRFYEINPAVPRLSRGTHPFFTFLRHCRGRVEIAMGDARLSLERELEGGENQRFDVLALDAFSSDAIPVHLLTDEAFGIYLRHLRQPDGILAVHISNRYIDLIPVVHGYAKRHGLASAMITSNEDEEGAWSSDWILIAGSTRTLVRDPIGGAATPWDSTTYREIRPWTDDYSNMIGLLRNAASPP